MLHYLTLLGFILCFASLYTLAAYYIASNPWVSTFITAAGGVVFILENMELNRILIDQETELKLAKHTTQITLIPKINELNSEIKYLNGLITERGLRREHMKPPQKYPRSPERRQCRAYNSL
jgi:hypothetical protein